MLKPGECLPAKDYGGNATAAGGPCDDGRTGALPIKRAGQGAGRFVQLNTFVDSTMRGLSGSGQAAWIVLFRDTKPGGVASTSVADLARRMGCAARTANRALKELKDRGLVEVVQKGAPGRGASRYRVHAHGRRASV